MFIIGNLQFGEHYLHQNDDVKSSASSQDQEPSHGLYLALMLLPT
jgi:hypothetical protein